MGMFTPADTVYRLPTGELTERQPADTPDANRFRRVYNTLLVAAKWNAALQQDSYL